MTQQDGRRRQNDDDDAITVMTVDTDAPEDANPPPAIHHQPKLGGKFLGCCCDYRRAVLILGAATASMGLLDLFFRIGNLNQPYEPPFDDDQLVDELVALNESFQIPYFLLESMAVVFGGVAVLGAVSFSQLGTCVAFLYGIGSNIMALLLDLHGRESVNSILNSFGQATMPPPVAFYCIIGIIQMIWWYPSLCLWWEIRRGIMTRRTYVREEFSCCCQD